VRRRVSHVFYTIGSQMAVRLSVLHSGPCLPPGKFLVQLEISSLLVDAGVFIEFSGFYFFAVLFLFWLKFRGWLSVM
jgi:hypothetical protein